MSNGNVVMTRRRFLGSLISVGGASGAAGAGTMASFSDSEVSSGNTIQAGTLNLELGEGQTTVEFLKRTHLEPSDEPEGPARLPVQNTGSVPGYLTVEVASIDGDLQEYLLVKAEFETRGALWDGFQLADEVLLPGMQYNDPVELGGGKSDRFEFSWHLPSDTSTDAEGAGLEFELRFSLTQHAGQDA